MNKKINFLTALLLFSCFAFAQPTIYPAPANKGMILLTNGTIHTGNGKVISNGSILINKDKIEKVGTGIAAPSGAQVIDLKGKHVYPGLISPVTNLGLAESGSGAPGYDDFDELGDLNPSVRSIVAYNTDSKIINVLRSNGILFANVVPQNEGGSTQLITGTSSVVQLDAWNWEDAAYKIDGQMHYNMPSLRPRRGRFFAEAAGPQVSPVKAALENIEKVKSFFKSAKSYNAEVVHKETNLNYEATKSLFDKKQKLFVHCDGVKEMLLAIDFVKEFGFDVVIVGGADSWQIAPLLKDNNVAVILNQPHSLPASNDDDVDQPFKTPAMLQTAGVLFALSDVDRTTRGRNLMFNAGTSAAYGLSKEEALSAITFNTAKILGLDKTIGTIEEGKDASIIVSAGDIMDMESNNVESAFIQGRKIDLSNHQTQLAERFEQKYGVKGSK